MLLIVSFYGNCENEIVYIFSPAFLFVALLLAYMYQQHSLRSTPTRVHAGIRAPARPAAAPSYIVVFIIGAAATTTTHAASFARGVNVACRFLYAH